ncbi:MAG: alpha/beta hydrolase [Leptolyngbyaceae cyanobacterium SL_5_9]|nr:alpha/beta hydrolase [Leptolyngbyaceae cyanobacterium SM1_4_3]NJN58272.1 alpha/beta hydrolase [Leptolyngbyaceae cyanobacterium SL_5_9]NJO66921.1 alpha/beta hydrolase [Leptolyngbyaceae cyanobacterium RM1_405_57]
MTLPIRNSRIRLSQGQLFWREVGQGAALVFLHGSWTDSSQWLPLVERLSQTYHCVAPDLLGFAESERPKLHYSIELQVECLAEYLEALKLRQVYLVGHSLGGWIAASYALRFADQVKGLVLLSPEGVQLEGGDRWQWSRWLTRQPPLALWLLKLLLPFAKVFGWRESIERSLQLRQTLMRSPVACKLLFNRRNAEIRAELLSTDRISCLKLPILILQGQDDATAARPNQAIAQAPQAELKLISNVDPDLLQTESRAIATEIRKFIETL